MSNTEQILTVSVEARINRLEREMRKASGVVGKNFTDIEKRSKKAGDRMERQWEGMAGSFAGIGKSFAAGLLGGFVAGGVMGISNRLGDIVKGIAEIGDEAKRAGLGIEEFQELKYVAEQNRIGVDSLVDGIKELGLRADEFIVTGGGSAAEAFQRLGYDAETLSLKLKDPSALFTEIIGKLGHLDRAAQIRIADELFGGTGGEKFVQLIEQGADAIWDTRREARELGLVMDEDLIDKADELDRKFNQVAATVGTALKTAIVEASVALGEFIEAFNQLPGMVDMRAVTAPLNERGIDIMQRQLASKQATLDAMIANEANGEFGGWFGTTLGHDEAKDALAAEIAALSAAIETRLDPSQFDVGGVFEGLTTPTYDSVEDMQAALNPPAPTAITVTNPGSGPGGGRSASSMREQRDAAAELIAELQNELAVLGMSEAEQRINAELRRAGAGATDKQQQTIGGLVESIETERAAIQRLEDAMENAKGMAKGFLGGLLTDLRNGVDGATALANAFGRLADQLMQMAVDGLVEWIFGAITGSLGFKDGGVVEAATGGFIRGPGTGTSDSIPARLSNGEYVINAAQTAKHRDLLDAINSGKVAAFATGGVVGDAPRFRPANDNLGFAANDNAPITINAPVTVNGSAGTPVQNEDLANRTAKKMKETMRSVVADEIRRQRRPGNMLGRR